MGKITGNLAEQTTSGNGNGSEAVDLGEFLQQAYLDYSVSVVTDRALPDVRDGLKPVHRRILYAMHKLGLGPKSASPKKSARVVGDVIGKYHPHGDAAVYGALAILAQDFSVRHPLIRGTGNWGSPDGDAPAAMRYTEAKLSEFAELLLQEVDKGTVDWRPNYDGNELEPAVLPARVPAVLLNDQMGIAVGMSSDIPGHNLGEVAQAAVWWMRDRPHLSTEGKQASGLDALMQHIPGPDFPGGGQITNSPEELRDIYANGRGMLRVRGSYHIQKEKNGWHLVFTQLPPKVSSENVVVELEQIANPKASKKNKKNGGRAKGSALTAAQRAARDKLQSMVGDIQNGAGKDTGSVHLEVWPKSRRQKPEDLAEYLFAVTNLESTVKVNLTILGLDGRPRCMGLEEIIDEWTQFRCETIRNRCETRLGRVNERLEILHGFLIILASIDEVIALIRASEDDAQAKAGLMARWNLTELQADKVLDLRLRRLTRLDALAIENEEGKLAGEKRDLEGVLGSRKRLVRVVVEELLADAKLHGSERRTKIEVAQRAVLDASAHVPDEPVTVVMSQKQWLRTRAGHDIDVSSLSWKQGDGGGFVETSRTRENALFFGASGRVYTVPVHQIPGGRGDGVPLSSLVELSPGESIVGMICAPAQGVTLLLSSTLGYGFLVKSQDLEGRNRNGKQVVNPGDGSQMEPIVVKPQDDRVVALSNAGFMVVFELAEIKQLSRGKGVKLLGLKPGEALAWLGVFNHEESLRLPRARGEGKRAVLVEPENWHEFVRPRGRRGRRSPKGAIGTSAKKTPQSRRGQRPTMSKISQKGLFDD